MADLGNTISLDASRFAAGVAETRAKLTELNTAFVENRNRMKELNKEAKDLQRQEQELSKEMKNGGTAEQRQQLQQLRDRMAQVNSEIGTLRTREQELRSDISQTNRELQEQRTNASGLSDTFSQLGQLFAGLGIAEACHQIANAFSECVRAAADFEATMSTVEALSGATASQMQELTDKAKQLGATTKFTATESAQAMTFMGMAGWDATQMLNGMDGVMSLAAASGTDLATTADIITDALTAFGLTAEETGHFADVLAATATNSNTSVEIMGETFKGCASVAGALNYSIEDVSAAIGLMANAGVKGTIAGTALKNTFNGLLNGATLSAKAFGEVEVSAVNADGTMKDFGETINELRGYFSQMSEAERVMNAMDIAGKYGYNGLLAIVNSTQQEFDKLTNSINECEGAAKDMAEVRMDNLQGQLTLMDSAADALKTTVGESFQEELRGLAEAGTGILTVINGVLSKSPVLTKGVTALTVELIALGSAIVLSKGIAGMSPMLDKLGISLKGAEAAQRALNTAMKAAPYAMIATAAMTLAVSGMEYLSNRTEEAQKNIAELAEEVSNLTQEAKSAVEEQRQLEDVIEEYENIDKTITDTTKKKEELSRLQETLNGLYEEEKGKIDLVNGSYAEQIEKLKDLNKEKSDYEKAKASEALDAAENAITEASAHQVPITFDWKGVNKDFEEEMSNLFKTLESRGQVSLSRLAENERELLVNGNIYSQISALKELKKTMEDTGAYTGVYADSYTKICDKLKELNGLIDNKAELTALTYGIERTGEVSDDTAESIEKTANQAELLKQALEDAGNAKKNIDDLSKSANALVTEYSTLYDTLKELQSGEAVSYEKIQALVKIYPELSKYIKVTADGYTVETGALGDLNNALDDSVKAQIEAEKGKTQAAIQGSKDRIKLYLKEMETYAKSGETSKANQIKQAADAERATISELEASIDSYDTLPAYLASNRGKGTKSGGSGGKKSDNTTKEKEPPGLKSLMGYAKTTSAAFKEIQDNGELALSTVQALIDAGYEQALAYDKATDSWKILTDETVKGAGAGKRSFEDLFEAQITAAHGVEDLSDTEKQALESLGKEVDNVTAGVYGLAKAEKELNVLELGNADSDFTMLSKAVAEQNSGELSPDTVAKLSKSRYSAAIDVEADGKITLNTDKLKATISDELDKAINDLNAKLETAEEGDIPGLKAQIQQFKNLKAVIDDVVSGLYGVEKAENKIVSDDAMKALRADADARLKIIDEELKAKQKLRDETLKAIDDEVQARKRLTEDNDIQRQIDQATAQLNYSQLDEFSRAQLERKIQSLKNDKADMLWERGIEDRKAAVNSEYDSSAAELEAEKTAISNALETFATLNETVINSTDDLKAAITKALEETKPDNTFNMVFENTGSLSDAQIAQVVQIMKDRYGA